MWNPFRRKPKQTEVEDQLLQSFREGNCPDCGCDELMEGPSGGLSTNVKCAHCHNRFNLMILPCHGLVRVERI